MKDLEFVIRLKSGHENDALAMLAAYNKCFKNHRFLFSTGIHVNRKTFKPERPGSDLKAYLDKADKALQSLKAEDQPVNNMSLYERLELVRDRYKWDGSEVSIWNGSNVERYTLPEGVSKEEVNQKINQELQKQKPDFAKLLASVTSKGANSLFGFWQKVIEGKVKAKNGKPLTANTIKAKKQTLEILKRYEEYAKVTLTFDSMTMAFYQGFMQWMETVGKETIDSEGKKHLAPYDINSRGKNIKDVKAILNLARINEYFSHDKFTRWPIPKERNEVVTLTKEELLHINTLELSGTKDDVRDIFVLACFLGARISDFKAFKTENLYSQSGVTFFQYVQEKTGSICKIPVNAIAQKILDKRNGQFPKMISEQNFRSHLKQICKASELNHRVIVKIRDNKPVYEKKWEAISPHSARRTFATSLFYGWFTRPLPASYCMLYTGHNSEKSFLLYIDAKAKEVNEKALEYFYPQPQMKAS